jgi:hypothetical protein
VCGYRCLTIGCNAKLTREECGPKLSQHAGNLTARWAVACGHRTTREGGVGGDQRATECSSINAHSVMPFASKRPS